ncbi:MAG: Nif11-like leader peptide family RiPP precursor [Proteobacteria bacterium]|nr:Nif11-like leader peptide family RiPP precursor [Pseudomonadota bacterium]
MSQADIQRFVADLKSNADLRNEVTGSASGIGSVLEVAKEHGYDISVSEARDYIRSQASSELSDEQLDQIAGGKGHHSVSSATQAVQVQTAATFTTEAINAETSVDVAGEVVAVIVVT